MNPPQMINVLIVDDDSQDIYLLHKALVRSGVENVEAVRSGQDASKYIVGLTPFAGRPQPDLIFLDLKMTGIDGFQFISFVKKNPLFRNIPLIVLSGSSDPGDKEKALDLGATAFFQKSMDLAGTKAMLDEIFNLCVS